MNGICLLGYLLVGKIRLEVTDFFRDHWCMALVRVVTILNPKGSPQNEYARKVPKESAEEKPKTWFNNP